VGGTQVKIPYSPREWALQFHNSDKRWIVLVLHRRAGKTTAALNHLQRSALTTPNSRYGYIAPTYRQAKNIAWDLLKQFSRVIPGIEYNETELTVKYPNGSKLTLYGADNPDGCNK
jgi:phage terminase large subunit